MKRFPQTTDNLTTEESSLASSEVLLTPIRTSPVSAYRRCLGFPQLMAMERTDTQFVGTCEEADYADSSIQALGLLMYRFPIGDVHCKSLILYPMACQQEQNGTRKRQGRKPEKTIFPLFLVLTHKKKYAQSVFHDDLLFLLQRLKDSFHRSMALLTFCH